MLCGRRRVECAFDYGIAAVTGERGFQITGVRLREELEVHDGNLRFQAVEERANEHGRGDGRRRVGGDAEIEPGESCLGLRVTSVVDVESLCAGGNFAGEDFVVPRLHAFAAREEEIGLGELIAVKKIEVRIVEAALRVQHYGERRDLKASATLAQEGTQCSGDDIGATAHGFGEYNAGAKFEQTDGGVHEIGKAAAKTSAGDLIAIDTEGGGVVSIHEVACLVVEDDGGAESGCWRRRAAVRMRVVLPAPRNPPTTARMGLRSELKMASLSASTTI